MNARLSMGMGLVIDQRMALHITPCLRRSRDQRPDEGPGAPWREQRRDATRHAERLEERPTVEGDVTPDT